jgi:NTP pyrophosphatase (non-canonical NTP hydrolase)
MMRRLYFRRDSKRGAKGTYDWLLDEVRELGDALESMDRNELAAEFADVIAWLASLANVVNVDLEMVTMAKYDNRCPKCGRSPCQCTFRARSTNVSAQRR